MTTSGFKHKVINGLLWKLLERFASQGISFIIQIILARLLFPHEFGMMAIISLLFIFFNTFVEGGFSRSLIQKKDADNLDFSSVFWLSLILAAVFYTVLFFFAPYIAEFYQSPQLVALIRVYSINMFIGSLYVVQSSFLIKEMEFKKLFIRNLFGAIVSGVLGITAAYMGFGIWALVIQQTVRGIAFAVSLNIIVSWKPSFCFHIGRIKSLLKFGWKLVISTLIFNIQHEIRSLFIGKAFNFDMLGFYNRGNQFPELIVENVNGAVQAVMFPAFSMQQDNLSKIKHMIRQSVRLTSFVMFPILMYLAAVAEPLTKLLLTEKWLPSVPYIRIMAFSSLLRPISSFNLQAIIAMGRSDIDLKLGLAKLAINIAILLITIPYGLIAVAWGVLLTTYFGALLNAFPNKILLGYSYREQFADIVPIFIISLCMAFTVYCVQFFGFSSLITLMIQFIVGVVFYIGFSYIIKSDPLKYLWTSLKVVKGRSGWKQNDNLNTKI